MCKCQQLGPEGRNPRFILSSRLPFTSTRNYQPNSALSLSGASLSRGSFYSFLHWSAEDTPVSLPVGRFSIPEGHCDPNIVSWALPCPQPNVNPYRGRPPRGKASAGQLRRASKVRHTLSILQTPVVFFKHSLEKSQGQGFEPFAQITTHPSFPRFQLRRYGHTCAPPGLRDSNSFLPSA